jgi:hypothetical protein
MRGKLLFVAGAGVGYVLGARAGRKRYEQIKAAAAKIWETPGIQKQVNAVEDYAAAKFGELPGALFEGTRKVVTQVVTRAQAAQRQSSPYEARVTPETPAAGTSAPSARSSARVYTSSVTIAAPPDEETATAPVSAPKAAATPKKRKAAPTAAAIDEADDAGA